MLTSLLEGLILSMYLAQCIHVLEIRSDAIKKKVIRQIYVYALELLDLFFFVF